MTRPGLRICNRPRCRTAAAPGRLGCWCCLKAEWRARRPMQDAFAKKRANAKQRGIEFRLTFEQFEKFATKIGYLGRSGNDAESITIDRKDNLRGYVVDNLQPLTRRQNTVKRNRHDAIRMKAGMRWNPDFVYEPAQLDPDNCPF